VLAAGVTMLREHGPLPGVAHVRLVDAAHRAGYTTGAVYRCWENQEHFHRELAVAASADHEAPVIANLVGAVRTSVEAQAPLAEVIRLAANDNIRAPRSSEGLAALAIRASAASDEQVRSASRARFVDGIADHARCYETLLHVNRRRVRPPFTIADLALALGALGDGFTIQTQLGIAHPCVSRDDVGPSVGEDWTMFAFVVEAIVDRLTEPIPASV
jgi:hypothetical protein